tara:strand:+ start:64 stop:1743 length:1680 start_codon:yes stop_codon:yes gene_type:complete
MSLLAFAGGAAKEGSRLIKEDKDYRQSLVSKGVAVTLPLVLAERKKNKEKEQRYVEYNNQLKNLGLTPAISRSIMESGEEFTKDYIKQTQEYLLTEGTKIESLKDLVDAGIISEEQAVEKKVSRPFDKWFKESIVGLAKGKGNSTDFTELEREQARHFGTLNPDLLKNSIYENVGAILGDTNIDNIRASIEADRERVQSENRFNVLLPENLKLQAQGVADRSALKTAKYLSKPITFIVNGKPRTFPNYQAAEAEIGLEASLSTIAYNNARAVAETQPELGQKELLKKLNQSYSLHQNTVTAIVGLRYTIPDGGGPAQLAGFAQQEGSDDNQRLTSVIQAVTTQFFGDYADAGRAWSSQNQKDSINGLGEIMKSLNNQQRIVGSMAAAAAAYDQAEGGENYKNVLLNSIGNTSLKNIFKNTYQENRGPNTGGASGLGPVGYGSVEEVSPKGLNFLGEIGRYSKTGQRSSSVNIRNAFEANFDKDIKPKLLVLIKNSQLDSDLKRKYTNLINGNDAASKVYESRSFAIDVLGTGTKSLSQVFSGKNKIDSDLVKKVQGAFE